MESGAETGEVEIAARWTRVLVILGLAAFAVLLSLAAFCYPGGSWADPGAKRFDLLHNYWCDLFRVEAVNGRPNAVSTLLARLAFLAVAAILPPFWWLASRRLAGPRARLVVIGSGLANAAGVAIVAMLSYRGYALVHVAITSAAGAFGLVAGAIVLRADLPPVSPLNATRAWGLALVVSVAANLAIYLPLAVRGGNSATLPAVQKLATVSVLGWMLTITRARCRTGKERE